MDIQNIIELITACGIGGALPTLIDKMFSRKKNKTDIANEQLSLIQTVNENLRRVISELQDISCFNDKCRKRISGKDEKIKSHS